MNIYNLYLDYKQFSKKPLNINEKLSKLRHEFEQRKNATTDIPRDFVFSDSKGFLIKKENEKNKSIKDIITNENNINIISTSNFYIYYDNKLLENDNQKEYDVFEFEEFTLKEFRDNKNIQNNFLFIDSNENLIDIPEEKNFKLIDFIVKGKLNLKSYDYKKNDNYDNNDNNYNYKSAPNITEINSPYDESIYNNNNNNNNNINNNNKNVNSPPPKIGPKRKVLHINNKNIIKGIKTFIYEDEENIFSQEEDKKYYKILFLGEEGSGKTSFINSIINCIKKVKPEDYNRYIISPLGHTSRIQVYNATNAEKKQFFKFIDTPGIKFENGKSNIDEIKKAIEKFFFEEKFITAIFILIKNTDTKLNANIQLIHNDICELLEKEIAKNIRFIISFYDDNKIQCEDLIKKLYGNFFDVKKEILFPINNNHIINIQDANITYDNFLSTMKKVENFISNIITIEPINLEMSYQIIFYQNVIEDFIKQIIDNFLQIYLIFQIEEKNENDLFEKKKMLFRQFINNIIFYVKHIFIFEKPLNEHILKKINSRDKILNELQITIKNQSILEKTKKIFISFFKFVDGRKTEIEYDNIYKNLNEIYLKHSQNNRKFSTSNKFDNTIHKINSKFNLNYPRDFEIPKNTWKSFKK